MTHDILRLLVLVAALLGLSAVLHAAAGADLTLRLTDYATLPITGALDGTTNNAGSLARINFMRQAPRETRSGPDPSTRGGGQFWANDLNGPLYILGADRKAIKYLDFNGRGTNPGLFDRLPTENGLASGFISFEFDPDYARNGRFYTIHLEDVALPGSHHARGGESLHLPGKAASAPNGRIDLRFAVDRQGGIYFLTKSDGAIRAVTGVMTGGGASSPSR